MKNNNATKKVISQLATKLSFQPLRRWKKVTKSFFTAVFLQVHTFEIPWSAAKFSLKTLLWSSGPGTSLSADDKALWGAFPKGFSMARLWRAVTIPADFWAQKRQRRKKEVKRKYISGGIFFLSLSQAPLPTPLVCFFSLWYQVKKKKQTWCKILNSLNGHLWMYFY